MANVGFKHDVAVLSGLLLLVPVQGCKTLIQHNSAQIDSDPKIRQKVVEGARGSCLQSSHAAFPQAVPNREALITGYCKCFSEQGMNSFTNSELATIGLTPGNKLSPEQEKKLDAAASMCINQAKQQISGPTQEQAPASPAIPAK